MKGSALQKEDKRLQEYFKRELHGGKGAAARLLDALLLRGLLALAFYAWFSAQLQSRVLAVILTLCALGTFCIAAQMYSSIRLENFIRKKRQELYEQALLEHLMLLSPEEAETLMEQREGSMNFFLPVHPRKEAEPALLLQAYHRARRKNFQRMELYATGQFSQDAKVLAGQMKIQVGLHEAKELIALAKEKELLPEEETIRRAIDAHFDALRRQKSGRQRIFLPGNAKRFLLCAALIGAASWITGYRIYYPLMAALCLCLAAVCWWMGRNPYRQADSPHV